MLKGSLTPYRLALSFLSSFLWTITSTPIFRSWFRRVLIIGSWFTQNQVARSSCTRELDLRDSRAISSLSRRPGKLIRLHPGRVEAGQDRRMRIRLQDPDASASEMLYQCCV